MADEVKIILTVSNDQLKQGMAEAAATIKKTVDDTSSEFGSMASTIKGYLSGVGATLAGVFAVNKIAGWIKDITLAAARYETLGVVVKTVGNNAGYTSKEIDEFTGGLEKAGISMSGARESLTRMTQAHLDLNQSTKLARVAQDAAVIGNINSTEAFQRMVYGIQSAQVEMLRTIGINVNFENSYQRVAKETGRAVTSFSETEKAAIRMNEVLKAGEGIAGTYEAAMGTAGKQLASLERHFENLKVLAGAALTPALAEIVETITGAVVDLNGELSGNSKTAISEWGTNFRITIIKIEAEITRLAMFLDKVGGTMTSGKMLLYGPGNMLGIESSTKRFKAAADDNMEYERRYYESEQRLQKLADKQVKLEYSLTDQGKAEAAAAASALEDKRLKAAGASTKPGGSPDTKTSRVPDWKNELVQIKVAEDAFFNFSLSREKAFWESKLRLAKANSAESRAVQHELYEIRKKMAQTATDEEIANLKLMQAADKTGNAEKIAIQEEIIAATGSLYGQDSSNYRNALRDKQKLEEDLARETMNTRLDELKAQQTSDKTAWDQKLALENQKLAIIKEHYSEDSREYKNALLEKLRFEEEAASASIAIQQKITGYETANSESSIRIKEIETHTLIELGRISKKEEIELNRQHLDEIYNLKLAALNREAELLQQYPEKYRAVQDRIRALQLQHNEDIAKSQQTLALEQKSRWDTILSPIKSALDSSVQGIIQGTTTLKQAMSNLCSSILTSVANMLIQIGLKWAQQQAMELAGIGATQAAHTAAAATTAATTAATAAVVIPAKAAEAGAGAAASQSFIPFIGPALALAAMATIFGAVMALKSASGGYDIPAGTNPITQLHSEEMVLPAGIANNVRNMTNQSSNSSESYASIPILTAIRTILAETRDITKNQRKLEVTKEIQSGNIMGVALGKSIAIPFAASGFDVPAGLNPVTQLHAEEMVLPANLANKVRNMSDGPVAGGASGGNVTFNVNAFDSKDVASFFKKNGSAIANALKGPQRDFQLNSILKGRI